MENDPVNPGDQVPVKPPRRPSNWWLIVVAALFIIVPFLTWYGTWFGRPLSDEKIAEYLADESKPRHIQHALTQIEQRMEKRDPSVRRFYPRLIELAKSPTAEVRSAAAWVMGQDNTSDDFHRALVELLKDNDPLVRRNAALQLVRFGDGSGRPELRAMLQSFEAKSPMAGTLVSLLPPGSKLRAGSLLARIRDTSGSVHEFRAPVDGTISAPSAKEGEQLTADQTIATLAPDRPMVLEALKALAYVGTKEELPFIETFTNPNSNDEISQRAARTARAISSRAENTR